MNQTNQNMKHFKFKIIVVITLAFLTSSNVVSYKRNNKKKIVACWQLDSTFIHDSLVYPAKPKIYQFTGTKLIIGEYFFKTGKDTKITSSPYSMEKENIQLLSNEGAVIDNAIIILLNKDNLILRTTFIKENLKTLYFSKREITDDGQINIKN